MVVLSGVEHRTIAIGNLPLGISHQAVLLPPRQSDRKRFVRSEIRHEVQRVHLLIAQKVLPPARSKPGLLHPFNAIVEVADGINDPGVCRVNRHRGSFSCCGLLPVVLIEKTTIRMSIRSAGIHPIKVCPGVSLAAASDAWKSPFARVNEKPPRTTLVVRGGVCASSRRSVGAVVATVRVGFEPTVTRRPRQFSRLVRSTAPPPHLVTAARTGRGGHGTAVPQNWSSVAVVPRKRIPPRSTVPPESG